MFGYFIRHHNPLARANRPRCAIVLGFNRHRRGIELLFACLRYGTGLVFACRRCAIGPVLVSGVIYHLFFWHYICALRTVDDAGDANRGLAVGIRTLTARELIPSEE